MPYETKLMEATCLTDHLNVMEERGWLLQKPIIFVPNAMGLRFLVVHWREKAEGK